MRNVLFIALGLFLLSNFEGDDQYKLILNANEVQKITLDCDGSEIPLSPTNQILFVDKLNSANCVGMVKGIVHQNLTIYLQNDEVVHIRILGNLFKWDGGGDFAYRFAISEKFITEFCAKNV